MAKDQHSEAEVARHSEAALKRRLATPHKPDTSLKAKKKTSRASRVRAEAQKQTALRRTGKA